MIERGDAELRAWLEPLANGATLAFAPPPLAGTSLALCAHLFEIDRPAAVALARNAPIEVRLGYLITAWGDAAAAHALLGRVLVAALAQATYEIEFGTSVRLAWGGLPLPAQPGFVVRVRVSEPRGIAAAPPVRATPRVEFAELANLRGRIVANDGAPLPGAAIEIEALARRAEADETGAFVFAGIPRSIDVTLLVRAKGREMRVHRPATANDEEVLVTFSL